MSNMGEVGVEEVDAEWRGLEQQRLELVSGSALHSVTHNVFVKGEATCVSCMDPRVAELQTFAGKPVGARWHIAGGGVLLPIRSWMQRAEMAAQMAYRRGAKRFSYHFGCSAFVKAIVGDADQIVEIRDRNPEAYSEIFTSKAQQYLNALTGLSEEPIYIGESEIVPAGFQNAIGAIIDDTGSFNSHPLADNHPLRRCFVIDNSSGGRLGPDFDGLLYWQTELRTAIGVAMDYGFGRHRFATSPFVITVVASRERLSQVTGEVESFARKHLAHLSLKVHGLEKPHRHHHHHEPVRTGSEAM